MLARFRKAVAAGVGGLTPPAVVGLLDLFGAHINNGTAAVLIGILSPIFAVGATVAAKPNADGAVTRPPVV
jgi:hypothetical protein